MQCMHNACSAPLTICAVMMMPIVGSRSNEGSKALPKKATTNATRPYMVHANTSAALCMTCMYGMYDLHVWYGMYVCLYIAHANTSAADG